MGIEILIGSVAPSVWGLKLQSLDLLTDGRLCQVEPLGGAVETAAIGDGHEGAQQLEIQHAFDQIL